MIFVLVIEGKTQSHFIALGLLSCAFVWSWRFKWGRINFSLNSYNANSHKKSFDEYIEPILEFVKFAQESKHEYFINFRIWNLDEEKSAKEFNKKVFDRINEVFDSNINIDEIYKEKPKNIRIARKIFFNFDEYFSWP